MAHLANDPSPEKRDSAPAPADRSVHHKVCKDCGTDVEGHWRYKRKGEYYCRSCFKRHAARRALRGRLSRTTIVLLLIVAVCLLALAILFIADEAHLWQFWRRSRP